MAWYKSFEGYEYQDTITDGNYKYYVAMHKSGSIVVSREHQTTEEIRFAVTKVANESEYNTLIQVANITNLTYKLRSEISV